MRCDGAGLHAHGPRHVRGLQAGGTERMRPEASGGTQRLPDHGGEGVQREPFEPDRALPIDLQDVPCRVWSRSRHSGRLLVSAERRCGEWERQDLQGCILRRLAGPSPIGSTRPVHEALHAQRSGRRVLTRLRSAEVAAPLHGVLLRPRFCHRRHRAATKRSTWQRVPALAPVSQSEVTERLCHAEPFAGAKMRGDDRTLKGEPA